MLTVFKLVAGVLAEPQVRLIDDQPETRWDAPGRAGRRAVESDANQATGRPRNLNLRNLSENFHGKFASERIARCRATVSIDAAEF